VLDTFTTGDLDGRPAITRHTFGEGVATYLGTRPDDQTLAAIMARALTDAGVEVPDVPAGVERVQRGQWLFLLNHNETEVTVALPEGATNTLTGEPLQADERLAGRGVLVAHLPA
jgi:beta-galactosidase